MYFTVFSTASSALHCRVCMEGSYPETKANHFDYVLIQYEFLYSVQYCLQYNVNITVYYSKVYSTLYSRVFRNYVLAYRQGR